MNGECIEYQNNQENIPMAANESRNVELAENASEINTYSCENFQHNQQYTEVLSSNNNNNNNNKLQSSDLDHYYTIQADLQGQQSNPTNEHSVRSDATFEQEEQQSVASFENEIPRVEFSKVPIYSKSNHVSRQRVQEEVPIEQQLNRLSEYSTTVTPIVCSNPTSTPVNPVCAQSENSNSTFDNYESYGSQTINTVALDNAQAQQTNSTSDNRLLQAEYNPDMQQQADNMQAESINLVLAHQWRERREKLPIMLLDTTSYAECQISRPEVVNTAEIQKRKLQFFQQKAEEQLATSSSPEQTTKLKRKPKQKQQPEPCCSQEQQQQPPQQPQQQQQQLHQAQNFYRLQQMQQQNHLHSVTPDNLSLSGQFAHSPVPLNSPIGSARQLPQQMLPYVQSTLPQPIPVKPILQPNNPNFPNPQQQIVLQMLQHQQLQQQILQYYQPALGSDFFKQWQQINQQKYQEALQENMVRHINSRKRRRHEMGDNKENTNVNSFEPALVMNQSVAEPSNVPDKYNEDSERKPISEGNVIVNLNDANTLPPNDEQIAKKEEESNNKCCPDPALCQNGMWYNKYAMLQNWLQTQQDTDQKESDNMQYKNAE